MIGQGGFGLTYIGYDYKLTTPVCIKEYFPSGGAMLGQDGSTRVYWSSGSTGAALKEGRETFVEEAKKAARVRILGSVVSVWDVFNENDTAYIVMEYIKGVTLKDYLKKRGTVMDSEECLGLLLPVIRDLQKVHEKGIVHRDISPDNLMVREDGKILLLDLGAAKDLLKGSEQSTLLITKKGFSPPEQHIEGMPIGSWTDVYAMCATIYWCMTGKMLPDVLYRVSDETLEFPKGMPEAMKEVLEHGLRTKVAERIRDMKELERGFETARGEITDPPMPPADSPVPQDDVQISTARSSDSNLANNDLQPDNARSGNASSDYKQSHNKRRVIISSILAAVLICVGSLIYKVYVAPDDERIDAEVESESSSTADTETADTEANDESASVYSVKNILINDSKLFAEVTGYDPEFVDDQGNKHLMVYVDMTNKWTYQETVSMGYSAVNKVAVPSSIIRLRPADKNDPNSAQIIIPPGETVPAKLDVDLSKLKAMNIDFVDEIKGDFRCDSSKEYYLIQPEFVLYPTGKSASEVETALVVEGSDKTVLFDNSDITFGIVKQNMNTKDLYSGLLNDEYGYIRYCVNKTDHRIDLYLDKAALDGITCYLYYGKDGNEKVFLNGDGGSPWMEIAKIGADMEAYGIIDFNDRYLEENNFDGISAVSEFTFAFYYGRPGYIVSYTDLITYRPNGE